MVSVKGSILMARRAFAQKRAVWDRVLGSTTALDREVLEGALLATSWYPLEVTSRLEASIEKHCGVGDRIYEEMGTFSAATNLRSLYRAFVSDASNPHTFYEKLLRAYPRMHDYGKAWSERLTPTSLAILHDFDGHASKSFCNISMGFFRAAGVNVGIKACAIAEPSVRLMAPLAARTSSPGRQPEIQPSSSEECARERARLMLVGQAERATDDGIRVGGREPSVRVLPRVRHARVRVSIEQRLCPFRDRPRKGGVVELVRRDRPKRTSDRFIARVRRLPNSQQRAKGFSDAAFRRVFDRDLFERSRAKRRTAARNTAHDWHGTPVRSGEARHRHGVTCFVLRGFLR